MATSISASELARSLADVLNRAAYRDEIFEIERGGRTLVLRAEASRYTKESVMKAFAEYCKKYPDPDLTLGDDLARARAASDDLDDVKDPWER